MLAIGIATLNALLRFRESRALVGHSRQVMAAAQGARGALVDMETGHRGFFITRDSSYLEPYRAGLAAVHEDTARLRALTRGDAAQQRRLDALAPIIRARVTLLDSGIEYLRAGQVDSATIIVRRGRGKALMDSARALLDGLSGDERRLLDVRLAAEDRRANVVLAVLIAGTLAAVILGLLANALLAGYASRQAADAAALAEQNEQLLAQQQTLEDQQTELEQQATELEATNEELLTANEDMAVQREIADAARQEAETASKAKSEFLSTMSHELRTPLNAIAGHVQLLEMGLHGPVTAEQKDTLRRVDRAQQHLLGLINDILNLARIESGKLEYDVQPVALAEMMADVTPMIEPQLAAKGLTHEVRLSDGKLLVWADRDRLRQILLNLLANAVKFTDPGGRVTVESIEPADVPDVVYLRVHDTGRGIAQDQLDRIFEPFVQLNRAPARPGEGTGLGLTISRELARGMGGDLWAASEVGAGSVFTLALRRAVLETGEPTDRRRLEERRVGNERHSDEDRREDGVPGLPPMRHEQPGNL